MLRRLADFWRFIRECARLLVEITAFTVVLALMLAVLIWVMRFMGAVE